MRLSTEEMPTNVDNTELFDLIDTAVSEELGIPVSKIYTNETGRFANTYGRKVAMYLAHTFLSQTSFAIGRRYKRNRRAVFRSCQEIEDARDDRDTDQKINAIEERLRVCRA